VEAIGADVAFRDAHAPQTNTTGDKSFSFVVDGCLFTDRVEAAPIFSAAIVRGAETAFAAGQATGSYPSTPIAAYRGFEVTVRPSSGGTVRLGLRCPERSDALEYATVRTLDPDQVSAYGTGLFQRLEHLLDALATELKAAQDGLAREETNLASYTEQLARPFQHEQALLTAQRELARIELKLTSGASTPRSSSKLGDEAAA
jgi:hypothetical protein